MTAADYNNRGILYYNKGLCDQAIADYTKAIELKPNNTCAYLNRGCAYRGKGDYDQAIADYEKLISLDPQKEEGYYKPADTYRKKGDINAAVGVWKRYLQTHPKEKADVYRQIGSVYHDDRNYPKAITYFTKAIEAAEGKDKAEYYYYRGWTYRAMGKFSKAVEDLTEALRLDLDNGTYLLRRAWTYEWKGEYAKAFGDYSAMIQHNREKQSALVNRGMAYRDLLGDYPKAAADFKEALKRNKEDTFALRENGILLLREGKARLALREFDKALAKDKDFKTRLWRGMALRRLGREDEARKAWETVVAETTKKLKSDKKDPYPLYVRGCALRRLGRYGEALADLEKAVEWYKNRYFIVEWGKTYLNAGKPMRTLEVFAMVLRVNPNDADAWLGKCRAYLKLGKKAQARAAYQKAIAIKPILAKEYPIRW